MFADLKTTALEWPANFTVRPPTMADLEAAVQLFNDCAVAKIGRPDTRLEDIRREWELPEFDLNRSVRVVVDEDGRLAGYVEVWDLAELPVNIWVWGRVHPDYEGLGIGTALLNWAEVRARQVLPRVPAHARVVMRCGSVSNYRAATELFEKWGMTLVRHFWSMKIELDVAPPAPALGVSPESGRPLQICTFADIQDEPNAARRVYRAMDEAFGDHWGHVPEPEESGFTRWSHFVFENEDYDPSLWFLAMDGDEIAGLSLCWPKTEEDPAMGWVGTLGVRRPWRQRGLALALLHHSFGEFHRCGQKRAGLGVDAASLTGATRLYEKAGMHVYRQFDLYEKELRPGEDLSLRSLE